MNPITVLLADDHLIVRQGLRALLEMETDIKVVGAAGNGRQAVTLAGKLSPDVVIMDIAMPVLNGLEATRQILKAMPSIKVLMLSTYNEEVYVDQAMALGASGYLVKQSAAHMLTKAIREVQRGKTFFSPAISKQRSHQDLRKGDRKALSIKTGRVLSSGEKENPHLIAGGKANSRTDEL